jgi:hypothetical protein
LKSNGKKRTKELSQTISQRKIERKIPKAIRAKKFWSLWYTKPQKIRQEGLFL